MKLHTRLANSCAAWASLSLSDGTMSAAEKEPEAEGIWRGFVLAPLLLVTFFAGRMLETWPLVLSTAPLLRSSISHALTPGFRERRCRASSMESEFEVGCVVGGGIVNIDARRRACVVCNGNALTRVLSAMVNPSDGLSQSSLVLGWLRLFTLRPRPLPSS